MQISVGDKGSSLMPWTGGGESWVSWRYSHARPVVALVLRDIAAHTPPDEFELACRDAATGEFVPLEISSSVQLDTAVQTLTLNVKVSNPADAALLGTFVALCRAMQALTKTQIYRTREQNVM